MISFALSGYFMILSITRRLKEAWCDCPPMGVFSKLLSWKGDLSLHGWQHWNRLLNWTNHQKKMNQYQLITQVDILGKW